MLQTSLVSTGNDVIPPVDRSKKDNTLTPPIKGMKKTYFSFLTLSDDTIAGRRFSCNCVPCLTHGEKRWNIGSECENYDACGPWDLFQMTSDGVFTARANDLLRDECDQDDSWPTAWHDMCGLEGAACARGVTKPGDTLLRCTYCPGDTTPGHESHFMNTPHPRAHTPPPLCLLSRCFPL